MAYDVGFAKAFPITPNDTTDLGATAGQAAEGLLVTVAGNLVFNPSQGSQITMTAVPCGTFIPIKTKRVLATGTTASVCGVYGR